MISSKKNLKTSSDTREIVKQRYGETAVGSARGCGCDCGCGEPELVSLDLGYSKEQMEVVPDGANLGLGCGNPTGTAQIKEGETVLDLGSGAGFDAFIAAKEVGKNGKVIGVDMTPEMVEKARKNAEKASAENVDFRLGYIEDLPVDSDSVDVIISNCVINLSTEKNKVFAEAARVLKPGGRLMVSDLVLLSPLPEAVEKSVEAYVGCVAGASLKGEYLSLIKDAGFENVEVLSETKFTGAFNENDPLVKSLGETPEQREHLIKAASESVRSLAVRAIKAR